MYLSISTICLNLPVYLGCRCVGMFAATVSHWHWRLLSAVSVWCQFVGLFADTILHYVWQADVDGDGQISYEDLFGTEWLVKVQTEDPEAGRLQKYGEESERVVRPQSLADSKATKKKGEAGACCCCCSCSTTDRQGCAACCKSFSECCKGCSECAGACAACVLM